MPLHIDMVKSPVSQSISPFSPLDGPPVHPQIEKEALTT
ncbi:hypothetical protein POX_e06381 [Penicillium oxalicum]|nr:hypothetical protein POX_e06381 [Penicillium oxalicum]KAI2788367.1 hypothetical protein POX_e06381 [Penicillium oxalicum]